MSRKTKKAPSKPWGRMGLRVWRQRLADVASVFVESTDEGEGFAEQVASYSDAEWTAMAGWARYHCAQEAVRLGMQHFSDWGGTEDVADWVGDWMGMYLDDEGLRAMIAYAEKLLRRGGKAGTKVA